MNERNEDNWEECEEPAGLEKMNELADLATGIVIGIIATSIAYLVAFHL